MASADPSRNKVQAGDSACKPGACCSSPSAICYWALVSLLAWGLLSLVGLIWHPLQTMPAFTILLAAAIGCFANWMKNRTFHCSITAWIFLAGAAAFLLNDAGVIHIEPRFVWWFVAIGTAIAFLLEWRYATRAVR